MKNFITFPIMERFFYRRNKYEKIMADDSRNDVDGDVDWSSARP
jgi:hypothetical protein